MADFGGCKFCKHFDKGNGGISCTAYPDGIPFMIQSWEFPHDVERPGQVPGILFEPIDDIESKGGRGSGNYGHMGRPGHVGGSGGGTTVSLGSDMSRYKLPPEKRVWQGSSHAQGTGGLSKLETGARGEALAMQVLGEAFGEEFQTVNVGINNAPVDIAGAGFAVEVKTGMASNSPSAQHWRATIGQPGKKEAELLKQMTSEQKRAHNQYKEQEIVRRKRDMVEYMSKTVGYDVSPLTVGIIMESSGNRADVFVFEGFHLRVPWKQGATEENYVGTFEVPSIKFYFSGQRRRFFATLGHSQG